MGLFAWMHGCMDAWMHERTVMQSCNHAIMQVFCMDAVKRETNCQSDLSYEWLELDNH